MLKHEGPRAFMLSYPTTLLMNVPYALIMGSSNEALRELINPTAEHSIGSYLLAGAGAGMLAAAATNPLDVVKTRLQTQHLRLAADGAGESVAAAAAAKVSEAAAGCPRTPLAYTGMVNTIMQLWAEEGARGFTRGMSARMLIHAPSVAICWTTYESVKHLFTTLRLFE